MESSDKLGSYDNYQLKMSHHEKPITDLAFNRDGDLLFSAAKQSDVYLSSTEGEVLGIFKGHEGAVNSLSVDWFSEKLVTGSFDRRCILWDVLTGQMLLSHNFNSSIKHVYFLPQGNTYLVTCDDSYSQKPTISLIDKRSKTIERQCNPRTVPSATISNYNETQIVFADTAGNLNLFENGSFSDYRTVQTHGSKINRIRPSWCSTFFTTASSDGQAKIVDFKDLQVQRKFSADEPLNDAAIFGSNDKFVCTGGLNARDVTTTRGKKDFDIMFYDIVTQKNIGAYSPHFGTINALALHPSDTIFCSGGEDAIISLTKMGKDFFDAPFTNLDE